MSVHIGYNIECIRTAKRIKQQTMAQSLDVSQQRWSQLIKQEQWTIEMLQKVSKIYNMTIDEMQQFDTEKSIVSKGDNNNFAIFIVNLNINGTDENSFDNIGNLVSQLNEMNKNKK